MSGPRHGGHGRGPGPRADAEVQLSGHHRQGRAHLRVPAAARLPAQPGWLRLLPGHDQLVSRPRRASVGSGLGAPRGREGKGHQSPAAGRAGRAQRDTPLPGAEKVSAGAPGSREKLGSEQGSRRRTRNCWRPRRAGGAEERSWRGEGPDVL